ncbi:class I SAM-dependent methyltransferase [Natronosporangium hydrolyticum]|uniref:Class I SAM-dependent methyltransferase n=1 Tax=Natronosporangium hydrolyticum TaxID=2811111 RepID=A0A895Y8Z5_9ACTN|nr:class I SAM-dependent methyltransferase [Natronosporangium hydrolyticum]QSB12785.1 class I SAM-dependent methyltransferase [Natronosporangium hydrolyticum]
MSTVDPPRYSPAWLELREPADAAARAAALIAPLRQLLPTGPLRIGDLGCGTGSMARWLAGRLPGPQHWLLIDQDPELLTHAVSHLPDQAADGSRVTGEARRYDLTELPADALAGLQLVTASALLDLLTGAELSHLAAVITAAGCPALLTLSVTGQVRFTPADPLDPSLAAAFNDHQRRRVGERRLLGPAAPTAAAATFADLGATVRVQESPWRLGPDQPALIDQWLRGWVAAACEQRPELSAPAEEYLARRLAAGHAGTLWVEIGHHDLLVTSRPGEPSPAATT